MPILQRGTIRAVRRCLVLRVVHLVFVRRDHQNVTKYFTRLPRTS